MRREWEPEDLVGAWTLVEGDWHLVGNKTGHTRLGFVLLLKFFELEGRFPRHAGELPPAAVAYVAAQVRVEPALFGDYAWAGRTIRARCAGAGRRSTAHRVVLIKTLLYTGVRVAELVALRLDDVDLDANRIRVNLGKGGKDRLVPFPATFAETLALHMDAMRHRGAVHLFESSWKKPYSTRGVRAMLTRYADAAGLTHPISPHQLRHFLFTWLKTQGIDDALIQPYSGHESRQSLEIYSRLALADAQQHYNEAITRFPV